MLILPAIDILGGSCVRLFKGEYDTAHKVAADPFETAASFERAGAQMLHIVDLDGAREGRAVNFQLIADILYSFQDFPRRQLRCYNNRVEPPDNFFFTDKTTEFFESVYSFFECRKLRFKPFFFIII